MSTTEGETEMIARDELIAAINNANAAAKRVHGTHYYERAHKYINELLDQLIGR